MQPLVLQLLALDPVPDDNDVKAGWGAFAIFVLLILAVAFLCWSFAKQMRKVRAADEAGVYDEPPADGSDQVPPAPSHTDS
jgi:hypothetical protein